jgi:hypothetical protein
MKTKLIQLGLRAALLALPVAAQAQFTYTTNNGTITITGYTGSGSDVKISNSINGLPEVSILSCLWPLWLRFSLKDFLNLLV